MAPLGAYTVLGLPMEKISGQTVDLDDLLGRAGRQLAEQLREAPTPRPARRRCLVLRRPRRDLGCAPGGRSIADRRGAARAAEPASADHDRLGGVDPSERRVAELVAAGKSNPDIAAELVVSRRTAQTHVSRILRKLDLTSRAEVGRSVERQARVRSEELGHR